MTNESKPSFLDTPLAAALKLDVEKGLYLLFTLAAIFTRFWRLGDRVMSHDESLHSYFSWGLYAGRGFQHTPLMHGPFLFHINALIYSLFGADDFTARISPALFGMALVLLPWALRRWLGRAGALAVSFMFLISPMIAFHARYIRNESYVTVWVMLTVWAMFAYLRDRKDKWLYLFVAASVLNLASKEVSFIYSAIFGSFLAVLVVIDVIRLRGWEWAGNGLARVMAAAGGVLVMLALGTAVEYALLTVFDPQTLPELTVPVVTSYLIGLGIVGALFGLVAFVVLRLILPNSIRDVPAFDLALLLGALYLPTLTPFVIGIKEASGEFYIPALLLFGIKIPGYNPVDYTAVGIVRSGGILMPFLAVSIALGLWWNGRRFLKNAGIWYGIFVMLFTTILTNSAGLATGMIGSLGYWLEQQGVQRGSQPAYYYTILVALYEYLPFIVSTVAIIVYAVRGFRFPIKTTNPAEKPEASKLENEITTFTLFLTCWIAMTWAFYSYAGEKMPWLTVHFALPMILLAGHFLGVVFEKLDWKGIARGWGVAILVPLAVVAFSGMTGAFGAGAFQGKELSELAATGQWLTAFAVGIGALTALIIIVSRVGWRTSAWVIGLEALALLAVLTVRTAWTWNYINYDYPVEYGVYAHGGPGVKVAQSQVEDIGRRTGGINALKVAYDSDSSWPFSWYLRDYTSAYLVGSTPTREQLNAPVVIGGSASWTAFEAILGDKYDKFTYRLIWWPMEDYKGKNQKALTVEEIAYAFSNPQMLRAFWDIWLNRDYKLYDQVTGETHTADKWPLVHDFRLYVRKDISAQMWDQHIGPVPIVPPAPDPYIKGRRDVAAVQVIGAGSGDKQVQLNAPHGLAIAPDGSLYVADSNNHRILKLDPSGNLALSFGSSSGAANAGAPPGTFTEPWGVAVGPDGSVYVADTWNHRIQKFDSNGNFIKAWGSAGQTDVNGPSGIFWGPRGIAIGQDGRVYVTDTGNKRIQVFSADGEFLMQVGGAGIQAGQLDEPVGLAIDPSGNIVVADTWNQRIQVLTPDGQPVRQWEIRGWLDQSVTDKPYVAVDQDGNIYVTDPTGFRVLVFGPDGTFRATFGDLGTDNKSFQLPIGVAVDSDGNIYVSDAGLARILKFPPLDLK